jgi:tetratricopeptide (TPR) repeat protein
MEHRSQFPAETQQRFPRLESAARGLYLPALAFAALSTLFSASARAQASVADEGTLRGNRAEISITLREKGGGIITTSGMIKIYHNGTLIGQTATSNGKASFIVATGDYTLTADASGYKSAQKDISLSMAITDEEEIFLVRDSAANEAAGVPGKPILAPKAKEEFDKALKALNDNKLDQAEKDLDEAAKLAPNHPDVLYLQGVVYLRKGNFAKAQTALETASQLDPNNARALSALGMAYADEGKYQQALPVLQHSLQLEPGAWDAHWTLARAYYHNAQYDDALKESQQALDGSHGAAPDIELLLAQSLTAVGRYEDAAEALRSFLKNHPKDPGADKARHWLDRLTADGKIKSN